MEDEVLHNHVNVNWVKHNRPKYSSLLVDKCL